MEQKNNPLHGKRLDDIIEALVLHYGGWELYMLKPQVKALTSLFGLKTTEKLQ